MKPYLLLLALTVICQNMSSQDTSKVIFEDDKITDILISEQVTYYATTKSIVRINSDDTKDELITIGCYLKGKFELTEDGWTYVGWEKLDVDVVYPTIIILNFDGESILTSHISYFGNFEIRGSIIDVLFESNEAIQILMHDFNTYKLVTTDIEHNEDVVLELDVPFVSEIILLNDNSKLIVSHDEIYLLNGTNISQVRDFNDEIIDIKYYPNEGKTLVLTQSNIFYIDEFFFTIRTLELQQTEREVISADIDDEKIYLLESEANQSYFSTYDSTGSIISEYIELIDLDYLDFRVKDSKIGIWGDSHCFLLSNVLKLGLGSIDFDIPATDLSIDDFQINYETTIIDTTVLSNGNVIYQEKNIYNWSLNIENKSTETVDSYIVRSYLRYGFQISYPITIDENESLLSGEIKSYEGKFSYSSFFSSNSHFYLNVATNKHDVNCSNNREYLALPTSSINIQEEIINIYPNPTSQVLNIETNKKCDFIIIDQLGRSLKRVKDFNQKTIDISELNPGIYFLDIRVGDNQNLIRFLKI